MNEVYDFCLQKLGMDPDISFKVYEKEFETLYRNTKIQNYSDEEILRKTYFVMKEILPNYNLKSFIHKFIINCDEIFIFRKQFATSLAINNLFSYVMKFEKNMTLNKISFNKESGAIIIHEMRYPNLKEYQYLTQNQFPVPLRLSRNIKVYNILFGLNMFFNLTSFHLIVGKKFLSLKNI